MRTTWLVILLLTVARSSSALEIDRFLSGSWYNPDQSGHGFSVEVISEDQTVIYWYVYHPDGTPTFLIAVGNNDHNVVEADVFYNSGMKFGEFDPDDIEEVPWGTITLTFQSCNSATLEYDSELEYKGVPYGSGSIPLTRLFSIDGLQCSEVPQAGLYQGNFVSDPSGDVMPGMAIISPDGEFAAVSYEAVAVVGDWSVIVNSFSGSGTAVSADPNDSFSSGMTLSGQISAEYRWVGSYNISGGDHGSLDLYAVPTLYRRGISLNTISGNYDIGNLVTSVTGSASLSSSGSLSGMDSAGCLYSGQVSLPDSNFNLLKIIMDVTSCDVASVNGHYTGYGAQIDYFHLGDGRILRFVTTNGSRAGVIDLYR